MPIQRLTGIVVKMDCACVIIVIWEGEMPIKCVPMRAHARAHTHGVKLHFLSPCHCCARDVGPDRSGWKMWSLFPSSSFSSSSPTTSLKIAGRERRQQSRGSICWSASGFNTPTTSTRGWGGVLWITPLIRILSASHAYLLDTWKWGLLF